MIGLYRLSLRLLPREVREEDGRAIVATLEDQLDATEGVGRRARIVTLAFARLPGAAIGMAMDARTTGGTPTGGGDGMRGMIRTIRQAARALRKAPAFTWATVLLLALGIGAGTAAFSVVDHVLLRPLPYPAPDRLVYMTNGSHSGPTLRRLDSVESFDTWVAAHGGTSNLVRDGAEPLRMNWVEVTPSFFGTFGASPHLGRLLVESDENSRNVGVLTHAAWQRVWGADPAVVGSTIRIDGNPVEVIGVLEADFAVPSVLTGRAPDLLYPMDWTDPLLEQPGYQAHSVAARLAPGMTIEQADLELDRVAADVTAAHADHYADYEEPIDWPLVSLADQTVGPRVARGLGLLLGAVGLLLLVACSNVAHLFLARGLGRTREMSVRRALGASTRALVTQLLAESLVVAAAAAAAGVGLAWLALRGFGRWTDALPRGETVSLDLPVLGFAVLLSIATVVLFGLVPALRSTRRELHDALRTSARSATSSRTVQALRSGLVIGEVAFSLVLVVTAGLLMKSFLEVTSQDFGIEPENVVVVPLSIPEMDGADAYVRLMTDLTDAVRRVPGVEAATWSGELPFENTGGRSCCWATGVQLGDEGEPVRLAGHSVDEDFFRTLGTEIVAGGHFRRGESEPVAVIGERTAIRGWGSAEAAVGRTIGVRGAERRIVGVAEHTLHYGLDQPHDVTAYIPAWQGGFALPWGSIAVKTRGDVDGVRPRLREAIWGVEPQLPIPTITPLESMIDSSTSTRRFGGVLASSFGVVALLLAAGGLYGTLLYTVGEQRRAIGIRIALGAGRGRIEAAVVGRALLLGVGGVVLGLGVSLYLSRFLEAFLFGITPRDGLSLTGAAVVLMAVIGVAAWLPARRAANTDPLDTLRTE